MPGKTCAKMAEDMWVFLVPLEVVAKNERKILGPFWMMINYKLDFNYYIYLLYFFKKNRGSGNLQNGGHFDFQGSMICRFVLIKNLQ